MREWLKWLVARKEMAELSRWNVQWNEHRRWLAEFPDAAIALDHLKEEVTGDYQCTIRDLRDLRDAMRVRRPQEAKQGEQL